MESDTPIEDDEWNFHVIPFERHQEALIWEYCRTQDWIRKAVAFAQDDWRYFERAELEAFPHLEAIAVKQLKTTESLIRRAWDRTCPVPRTSKENLGELLDVTEILARMSPSPRPASSLSYYDLKIVLGPGFPDHPYRGSANPVAVLHHLDGTPLSKVHAPERNYTKVTGPLPMNFLSASGSGFADQVYTYAGEDNGLPIDYGGPAALWRKFTLAIDFSSPDSELEEAFRAFLKTARADHGLKTAIKSKRTAAAGIPGWLNAKFATESLDALAALRLIHAFKGRAPDALRYYNKNLKHGQTYETPSEFKRASKRVKMVVGKLFGIKP